MRELVGFRPRGAERISCNPDGQTHTTLESREMRELGGSRLRRSELGVSRLRQRLAAPY